MKTVKGIIGAVVMSVVFASCGVANQASNSNLMNDEATSRSELKALADHFQSIMGDTEWMSEADIPWSAFYSTATVDARYSKADLKVALKVRGNTPIDVYTKVQTTETFKDLMEVNSDDNRRDAGRYAHLKNSMESKLQDVRFIKVGVPDSGALDLYIVGRTTDGKLVGLKTQSVET